MNKIYGLIMCIIILICLPFISSGQESPETAMELQNIADDFANEWDENATLIQINNLALFEGSWDKAGFQYYYSSNMGANATNYLIINVAQNGTIRVKDYNYHPSNLIEIHNWTIDSNEVWEIIRANETYLDYIASYPETYVNFNLKHYENESSPVWECSFTQWHSIYPVPDSGIYYGYNAEINANSGELSNVEILGEKPPAYRRYVCCVTVLIIIGVPIIYAIVRHMKTELPPQNKEEPARSEQGGFPQEIGPAQERKGGR